MDRCWERRKPWINLGLFLVVFGALCVHTHSFPLSGDANRTASQPENCRTDEYVSKKGHCCNKCFPGFRLTKECEHKDHRSTCEECQNKTFMENSNNHNRCFRCRICKADNYEMELSPCTSKQDRKCGCFDGYFKNQISIETSQCLKCTVCGDGMEELRKCTPDSDTQCKCKDDHYEHMNGECRPCKTCVDDENCKRQCNRTIEMPTQRPHPGDFKMPLIVLAVFFLACGTGIFALVFILYKRNSKCKMTSAISESPSSSTTESLMSSYPQDLKYCFREECTQSSGKDEVFAVQGVLPDCVPRELNTSQFIYFLLDHIPLDRFKELVRCLGVSDRDIERAERDNHTVKEAQYQMLRIWSESGSGSKPGALSYSHLLMMVKVLKDIGLAGCAEAIEGKYNTEQT